jgi:hypothetical protein
MNDVICSQKKISAAALRAFVINPAVYRKVINPAVYRKR